MNCFQRLDEQANTTAYSKEEMEAVLRETYRVMGMEWKGLDDPRISNCIPNASRTKAISSRALKRTVNKLKSGSNQGGYTGNARHARASVKSKKTESNWPVSGPMPFPFMKALLYQAVREEKAKERERAKNIEKNKRWYGIEK